MQIPCYDRFMGVKLKGIRPVYETSYGVCVWVMPDGAVLGDEDGNFLSLSGELHDPLVEIKLRKAAVYWCGEEAKLGNAKWIPGARQISDDEYDEQNDRLLRGVVPDPVDEARQALTKK